MTLDAGSTAMNEGVFNVGGTIAGTGGKVDVDGGSLFAGTVSGSNQYELSLDGAFEIGGAFAATSSIAFADNGADSLVLDNAGTTLSATIAGFGGANEIDIGSLAFSSQYTTSYSGTTLTISMGAGTVFSITDINPGAFALADDGSGGTEVTVCYARGTLIRTPDCDVPVESLKPGDKVITVAGYALVPVWVKWVGIRHINLAAHPRPLLVAPVVIERGAFADDVPRRCDDLGCDTPGLQYLLDGWSGSHGFHRLDPACDGGW